MTKRTDHPPGRAQPPGVNSMSAMLPCKQWAGLRAEGQRNSRAHVPGLLVCARALSCLTLRPVGCSPQGSPVHGRFQVRILDWAAISHSRGFSWPGDRSCVSLSPSPSLSRRGSRGGCVHGCDRANWDAPPPARFLGPLPSLPVSTICRTVSPTVLHSPGRVTGRLLLLWEARSKT